MQLTTHFEDKTLTHELTETGDTAIHKTFNDELKDLLAKVDRRYKDVSGISFI